MSGVDWNLPESISDQRLYLSALFFLTRIKHRYYNIDYLSVAQEICDYINEIDEPERAIATRAFNAKIGGIGTNRAMVLRDALLCWAAATDPYLLSGELEQKNKILAKRKKIWLQVVVETQRDGNFRTSEDLDIDGSRKYCYSSEFFAGDDQDDVDIVACDQGIKSKFNFYFKSFHPDARVDYDLDLYRLVKGFIIQRIVENYVQKNRTAQLDELFVDAETNSLKEKAYKIFFDFQLSKELDSSSIEIIRQYMVELFSIYGECILSDKHLNSMGLYFSEHGIDFISFTKSIGKQTVNLSVDELKSQEHCSIAKHKEYHAENSKHPITNKLAIFKPEDTQAIFSKLKNHSKVRYADLLRGDVETVVSNAFAAQNATALFWLQDRVRTPEAFSRDSSVQSIVTITEYHASNKSFGSSNSNSPKSTDMALFALYLQRRISDMLQEDEIKYNSEATENNVDVKRFELTF